MTDVITFATSLPPRGCSPNQSCHWSEKYTAKRDYREEVWVDARIALEERNSARTRSPRGTPFGSACLSLTFGTQTCRGDEKYHPTDPDNALASWKAGLDALCDAGLIEDDSHEHLEIGEIEIDPGCYGVTVTLERIEE